MIPILCNAGEGVQPHIVLLLPWPALMWEMRLLTSAGTCQTDQNHAAGQMCALLGNQTSTNLVRTRALPWLLIRKIDLQITVSEHTLMLARGETSSQPSSILPSKGWREYLVRSKPIGVCLNIWPPQQYPEIHSASTVHLQSICASSLAQETHPHLSLPIGSPDLWWYYIRLILKGPDQRT